MNRCLHITIHESSAAAPRGSKTYLAPRTGFDPEANIVMPQTDDPETNVVMPQTDDPEANVVMPQTDDPDQTGFLASGQGGYRAAVATLSSCCCCGSSSQTATASGSTVAPNPFVTQRDYSGFVIVRTAAGIEHPTANNLWTLAMAQTPPLTGLKAVLEMAIGSGTTTAEAEEKMFERRDLLPPPGTLVSRPLVELQIKDGKEAKPLGPGRTFHLLRGLEAKAAATPFPPLHSLTAYWRLDLRKHPELLEKVMEGLNRLAEVDLAYRELNAADPEAKVAGGKLFIEDQGYLDDAPVGIGAFWAWKSLAETNPIPPPVTLCDLEQGWTTDHLDLKALVPKDPFCGDNRAPGEGNPGHHGTAVLGQLAATGLVKGAAAELGRFVLASHYKSRNATEVVEGKTVPHPFAGTNGHVAAAIAQLLPDKPFGDLRKGDVLLLEVQRALLPTEVDEADFDAIRLASALGVIVVEAAGNGGFDLDAYTDPDTRRTLRRGASGFRDSGAIFVGAARASLPHDRAPFSNHGSRLDCFGWGETVTTCGYGDLAGTVDTDFYTNAFSGTSSAAPIVAGAAALVQALHKDQAGGYLLQPREMRDLLSDPATGTRQGPNVAGFIGVMPDLKAVLRGRLQLVPDVYMRRHVGDDGSAPGPDEEISSSPDILLWNGNEKPAVRFGEGPRSNTPAPGTPIDPANPESIYPNSLYVRLRNRGVGTGEAKVQIFASPAATLITPERWMPVGAIDIPKTPDGIVQGDILTVSSALAVDLPQQWQWPQKPMEWLNAVVPFYSFLAVQLPPESPSSERAPGYEKTVMLPPGPPYFQWDPFRSFLRGPGVTWRNIHPVQANTASPITLSFLIAGTPDRTRHFDFEVIQRLPAQAEVTLAVHPALAAKLRQRQPWLANGEEFLRLPHRPRTTLSRVALAPGVYAHAAFVIKIQSAKPLKGHSLAIRQLWRGEEVGRITWWFADE